MVLAAPVSSAVLSTLSPTGAGTPRRGIPCTFFEVLNMAKAPNFYSSKLTAAENRSVNRIIRRSWTNGREAGRKATFAQLYSQNRIKGGGA